MRKAITSTVIAFLILAGLLEIASVAAQPSQNVPVIVGFKGKTDAGLVRRHGGDVKYEYGIISAIACSLPQGAIDALERNPNIAYLELDGKVQMTQEPPSIFWSMPFDGVDRIDADLVQISVKGAGVKVAIIDTGIDYNHKDLYLNYKGGFDFVNNDADPMDDNGHGTLCAGIVVAEDDGSGVIGVAPKASLYGVKVLDATGSGDVSDVIAGIEWSMGPQHKMNIISMSLGTTTDYQAMHDICNAAYEAGILIVAAAGNDYRTRGRKELDTVGYPARYDSVIAVGATDNTDTRASYSSTGSALELVAPGENIKSTFLGGAYVIGGGTSMACPHVSGTAALILSSDPEMSASEVRSRLRDTADDLGSVGWDSWYGYGLVDANAMPSAPSITKLTPAVGAFINTATPTISATVKDVDGIAAPIVITLDGDIVTSTYEPLAGLVYCVPDPSLEEGLHTATLDASDTNGNYDITSWSFTVDMTAPAQVTDVTVTPISSTALFLSWTASTETDLAIYSVYRKAPSETEYTQIVWVCTYSEDGRAGFFPDTGLEPGKTYSYQITAWDIAGNEGDPSNPASGTTTTPEPGTMHVERIEMMWSYGSGTSPKHKSVYAEAWVRIVDAMGAPVESVTVKGHWEGATTDSDSGVTDAIGWARLRSNTVRNPSYGTKFTFMVEEDGVTKEEWTYDSSANGDFDGDGVSGDTSNSITYP